MPVLKLTPHFSLKEMTASGTAARLKISNAPPSDVKANLKRLCVELEKVRAITGKPLKVLSGYRCAEVNSAVGGAKNSYHLHGCAADFDPPAGLTHDEFQKKIAATPGVDFDLILEEKAKDGAHWLHFQIPRPGAKGRRLVKDAQLDKQGGAITRITPG